MREGEDITGATVVVGAAVIGFIALLVGVVWGLFWFFG